MPDLRRETARMLLESSKNLAQVIPSASFDLWKRTDFHLFIDFDKISKTEQDRIFNELEVSLLGLFDLHLGYIASLAPPEYKKVLEILKKGVVTEFLSLLTENGVEKYFVNVWEKLIEMRFKEYRDDYKTALSQVASWKELKHDKETRIAWSRIETITIDCLTHIRRGKVEKGDPLWKFLRQWFMSIDINIAPLKKLVFETS